MRVFVFACALVLPQCQRSQRSGGPLRPARPLLPLRSKPFPLFIKPMSLSRRSGAVVSEGVGAEHVVRA